MVGVFYDETFVTVDNGIDGKLVTVGDLMVEASKNGLAFRSETITRNEQPKLTETKGRSEGDVFTTWQYYIRRPSSDTTDANKGSCVVSGPTGRKKSSFFFGDKILPELDRCESGVHEP